MSDELIEINKPSNISQNKVLSCRDLDKYGVKVCVVENEGRYEKAVIPKGSTANVPSRVIRENFEEMVKELRWKESENNVRYKD